MDSQLDKKMHSGMVKHASASPEKVDNAPHAPIEMSGTMQSELVIGKMDTEFTNISHDARYKVERAKDSPRTVTLINGDNLSFERSVQ